jgi:hypothetical protein
MFTDFLGISPRSPPYEIVVQFDPLLLPQAQCSAVIALMKN